MITYTDSLSGITDQQLKGFFAGWSNPPSPQIHLNVLQNSHAVILALDSDAGKVVGFISAISDGVLSAYIPLLEVLPEYQGRGIGSELVQRMLGQLKGLYMIDLVCDEGLRSFYERLGMRKAFGMMQRNFDRQNGKES
jgi:ribosomal protein S18 acetylase RimI-like enzyme